MQFIGTICEVSENKSLVRVEYLGTKTKLIPYVQNANSFKRTFSPPRVGEQAIVHQLRDGGLKYAVGAIFNQGCREPDGSSQTKEITQYEDGTIISYDTSSSTLEILSPKQINITCDNVNLTAKNVNVTAKNTTVKSPDIKLLGNTLIQGAISTSGDGGGSGNFEINGNVKITGSITAGGDASFGGSVSDARGNLTDHTNNGYVRD